MLFLVVLLFSLVGHFGLALRAGNQALVANVDEAWDQVGEDSAEPTGEKSDSGKDIWGSAEVGCAWKKVWEFLRKLMKTIVTADCRAVPSNNTLDYLSENLDFSKLYLGNVSYYPNMYLPNIKKAFESNIGLLVYNCTEFKNFFVNWNKDMDLRTIMFQVIVAMAPSSTKSSTFFKLVQRAAEHLIQASTDIDTVHDLAEEPSMSDSDAMPFVQGGNEAWDTEEYAAELIGHTFLGVFLEHVKGELASDFLESGESDSGYFVLDLSGEEPPSDASEMQKFKARAVQLAPTSLLRTRGYLGYNNEKLLLKKVQVHYTANNTWLTFTPGTSTPTQWRVAKSALMSLSLFTVQNFHTGIHLFSGTVIEAASEALPVNSDLRGMFSPQATGAVFALLEQAMLLHSDHNSVFSGISWLCDVDKIRKLSQDIANFYFKAELIEIIGAGAEEYRWWAGGAKAFIEPITNFSISMANALNDTENVRETLVAKLKLVGGYEADHVKEKNGIASLYRNMLFVQGICHTHMWATREWLTPLMGWVSTEDMLPALLGSVDFYDPSVSFHQKEQAALVFATSGGFNSGAPEMGDGPWPYSNPNEGLAQSIDEFRQAVIATRQSIEEYFENHVGGFVPSYFFTVRAKKPFGYAITQTTYI